MEKKEDEFVVSATECTGIAPVPAETPEQAQATEELYALTKQKCAKRKPHGRSPIQPEKS